MSSYNLFQAQLLTFTALLQCDRKEYQEDWRKTPVVRDGGRFASSKPDGATAPASGTREKINQATQSAVRGMVEQIAKQVKKLPPEQQKEIMEMLDSPEAIAIKKSIRQLIDPEGQAAFDRIANEKPRTGREARLIDHIKSLGKAANDATEEGTEAEEIAITKGVLGGMMWPLLVIHMNQLNNPGVDTGKAAKETIKLLGIGPLLKGTIEDILQKGNANRERKKQQQLSKELNEFFLGVKKLEV